MNKKTDKVEKKSDAKDIKKISSFKKKEKN